MTRESLADWSWVLKSSEDSIEWTDILDFGCSLGRFFGQEVLKNSEHSIQNKIKDFSFPS